MSFLRLKYILSAVSALLFFSINVPARPQLPPLPVDSRIQKGTLGCGVTYFMVTDPREKGYVQVAIVQRDEPLSAAKREGLDAAFLGRMGIAPGPEGYVSDVDGSTVYRFRDVPFYRPEVLDSTLLFTFARVAESRAQQAVIVSGDIDAVELKKKMDIFSMLVPRMLVQENHMPDYVWEPSPAPVVLSRSDGDAEVSVTYSGSRIPFPYMNTAQAVVTDLFGAEFLVLLRHRLQRNLRSAGIPYGEIGFRSLRSADYGGDERYTVYVRVEPDLLDPAMRVIAETLGEMDAFGVSTREFTEAKQFLAPRLKGKAELIPDAEEYTDRCIAHFLFGAHLAPRQESLRYFFRKNVPDSTEARLFNRFSGALLSQLSNLTLEYSGAPDSLDRDESLFYYNLAYLYGSVVRSGKNYGWHSADTLGHQPVCPKVKLKSEKKEPVSGGTLWTFSNGMRVVFKQVKGSGMLCYALQLNGGLAHIDGLQEGEGGYMGQLLSLCDVSGLPAADFRDMLASNGITMETQVALNTMAITGSAPVGRLSLLMKSLVGLANERSLNAGEYHIFCRQQQLVKENFAGELFRKLNPDYTYNPYGMPQALTPQTQQKAARFYDERFSRMNDGVLILSGDLSEETVKRMMLKYLGCFRTQRGGVLRRPVEKRTVSGITTYTVQEGRPGVYVLMDTEFSLTAEQYYTAQLAEQSLRTALVRHLAPYGFAPYTRLLYSVQPQERFQMLIACYPIPGEGRPARVDDVSAERALTAVRAAIRQVAEERVDGQDLSAWKQLLHADVSRSLTVPEGFVSALLMRYAVNKDMITRYPEAIEGIDGTRVQTFLKGLAEGGRIEYMIP